ncbi:hypothetical protein BG015_011844 [Linnemannia schmuckeri]|uniref:C2H2-type domain-containing protein n=1 Tax=Linnemannia schmuckeri TaxID=64567 RepID=A0A9P5RUS8_9FUNG|nr:hypothetical protein BG015_011844 [Linnemannia schmuckeri]
MDSYPYQHQQRQHQQHYQHPLAHHPYAYAHAYPAYDNNTSRSTSIINNSNTTTGSHSSLSSAHSSKQTSPVPSITLTTKDFDSTAEMNGDTNDNDHINDTQDSKAHKGKLFQCTGFGDCRMVFTRSEHLARHARKHTGEKPFKCVVDGCTRMFSRFDNMVQHTQTHTKSGDAALNEQIAQRIAMETRRKSEAGGSAALGRRLSVKAIGAKRGSISSASGSDSPRRKSRHQRVQSLPMLNVMTDPHRRSSSPALPSPVTPSNSSPLAAKKRSKGVKSLGRESGRIHKTSQGATKPRSGSLEANKDISTESWYASKLHHRPSLDYAPSVQYPVLPNYNNNSSAFGQPRHPMSPAYSSYSDDVDSDDAGVLIKSEPFVPSHPLDHYKVEPMDDCTLPPLRTTLFLPEAQARLPSITHQNSRYRSRSIGFNATNYLPTEPYSSLKTRRFSLVDLNAPIQQANKATAHQAQSGTPIDQRVNGVDVSEDEMRALEAFGQLWSQGRDVEMNEAGASNNRSMTPHGSIGQGPYHVSTHAPGPDVGRRPSYPVMNLP